MTGLVFGVDFIDRCDVLIRHDQDVRRSNRMDILKGGYTIIFINDGGRGPSVHDFAEDAFIHIQSFDKDLHYYI